jgi:hypothetical protein
MDESAGLIDPSTGMPMYEDPSMMAPGGPMDYYGGSMMAPVDPMTGMPAEMAIPEYDYYAAMPPMAVGGEMDPNGYPVPSYEAYPPGPEYAGVEAYDQANYYGDYAYDYSQDPNYAANVAPTNGARFNPYARQ